MFSTLKQYLEMISEEENIPACDIVVYKGHDVVFRHMVGYRDAEKTEPVSEQDKYILYSATKPMTMVAVMQLVEKGMLRLEDEIYRYLPEFEHMSVKDRVNGKVNPAKNKITIEHLMTMTAGFNYSLKGTGIHEVIAENPNATLAEVMRGLAKQPLDFEPGTRFQYSLCHDVLGRIIEVVSGMTYGEYMKKNIFKPLEMHDTGYSIEEALPNLTEQYVPDGYPHKRKVVEPTNPYRLTPRYESAGAGAISTVNDYGKFVEAMCNYGVSASGVRIISEKSIDMMRTRLVSEDCHNDFRNSTTMRGYTYGLGVRVMINKLISGSKSPVGEFGWDGAAGAYVLIDVENKIGIFYAQEIRGKNMGGEVHPRIRNLVYEALEGRL